MKALVPTIVTHEGVYLNLPAMKARLSDDKFLAEVAAMIAVGVKKNDSPTIAFRNALCYVLSVCAGELERLPEGTCEFKPHVQKVSFAYNDLYIELVEAGAKVRKEPSIGRDYIVEALKHFDEGSVKFTAGYPHGAPCVKEVYDYAVKLKNDFDEERKSND